MYNIYKVYLIEEEQEALRYCGEFTIYPYPELENVCNKLFVKDAFYNFLYLFHDIFFGTTPLPLPTNNLYGRPLI